MAQSIQSFDVFDTLIARRCGGPHEILNLLEARSDTPGLAQARRVADQKLWNLGQPYDLRHLWQEAGLALALDSSRIQQLYDLEIHLEHEQVIPIVENLDQVRDGDLLISDTYLPRETIRSLLERAGLHRQVTLVVSNDGKSRGWIWPQLLANVAIARHIGDNPHSDGKTPSDAGIPAVIYTGSQRSPVEQLLIDRGWPLLAETAREVRLANPYSDNTSGERYLWLLTCQLNFPLLAIGSLWLERQARAQGVDKLLFVSRDGWLWQRLHRRLFPERASVYLYASRLCQFRPSESYRRYFDSLWTPNGAIVDLSSTGNSWSRFFAKSDQQARCCFLCFIDNYQYAPESADPSGRLDIAAAFRTSEIGAPIGKGLEMINYASHAVVEGVIELPGGHFHPVLSGTLEYDPRLPEVTRQAFGMGMERLDPRWSHSGHDEAALGALICELALLLCADRRLPQIYAGHFAHDLEYEARLRALRES